MSSFRKRNVQKPVPGTRTSPQTGQVITSSGNPSLDEILGGGLPIGSICLIEEDKYVTHSKVLAKYFLAEGVLSQQPIFLGSLDDEPRELLCKLPKPLNEDEVRLETDTEKDGDGNKNGLRIAWRYNDLPLVNSEQSSTKIGHHFNLLEQMDPQLVQRARVSIWNDAMLYNVADEEEQVELCADEDEEGDESKSNKDVEMENSKNTADDQAEAMDLDPSKTDDKISDDKLSEDKLSEDKLSVDKPSENKLSQPQGSQQLEQETEIFQNHKYLNIWMEIADQLREDKFNHALNHREKDLCRVCITSLGSPLWYDKGFANDILKFLTLLRAVVRNSLSVCFITMPMHLVAKCDESLVPKIRNLVDFAIELESFAGSERETNPAFRDYNGLFHLHKISAINTLTAFMPETSDLAFKLRRKKFVIEKLHLPPELQDASNADNVPTLSCGSSAGSNPKSASLDF